MNSTDKTAAVTAILLALFVCICGLAYAVYSKDTYLITAMPVAMVIAAVALAGGLKMLDKHENSH